MTAVLVILILTNLVTLALVIIERRRSTATTGVDAETFTAPRPTGLAGKTRRIISVEILNPMELVNNRGRMAGLAGSLAPGLARRVVYDQALKTLRRQLESKHVLADVRLHTLRSVPNAAADAGDARPVASVINAEPVETQPEHSTPEGTDWVESVEVIDLTPDGTDET